MTEPRPYNQQRTFTGGPGKPLEAESPSSLIRSIVDAIPEPTIAIDVDCRVVFANQAARQLSGIDPALREVCCFQLSHHRDRPCDEYGEVCPLREVVSTKLPVCVTHTHYDAQGRELFVEVTASPVFDEGGEVVRIVESWRDVSEPKGVRRLLEIANHHTSMKGMLEEFVEALRKLTGCGAIAIRVLDGDGGITHHAQLGFSREFCESESPLSIHTHQCLCIQVITGEIDARVPCCSEGGSVRVNSTSRFFASLSEDQKGRYRNLCNEFGLESLALIPIRDGGQILGLIQLADCRKDTISSKTVETLERLAMHLGTAIQRVRAEEALRAAHDDLDVTVKRRTAELTRANEALQKEIAERTRLEKEILQISADEQQRIGQELHDGLGQELTGLNCLAKSLRKKLKAKHLPEARVADELAQSIPKTLEQIGMIIKGLMPLEIGAEDLVPALEVLMGNVMEQTGVSCRLSATEAIKIENEHAALQVYRIAQEAVTNAVRHGHPRHVLVTLAERNGEVMLRIRDDGTGIGMVDHQASGSGLRIMAYRARTIGGRLEIARDPDAGTVVTCVFPKD